MPSTAGFYPVPHRTNIWPTGAPDYAVPIIVTIIIIVIVVVAAVVVAVAVAVVVAVAIAVAIAVVVVVVFVFVIVVVVVAAVAAVGGGFLTFGHIDEFPKFGHIGEFMRDTLHWFPVCQRIFYRVSTIAWRCILGVAPTYLSELCVLSSSCPSRRSLRSASRGDYLIPRSYTATKQTRAFSAAGPSF